MLPNAVDWAVSPLLAVFMAPNSDIAVLLWVCARRGRAGITGTMAGTVPAQRVNAYREVRLRGLAQTSPLGTIASAQDAE
jgi:hypothetical protein